MRGPRHNQGRPMKAKPTIRPGALLAGGVLAASLSLGACVRTEVFEWEYADGVRKTRAVYLSGSGGSPVRHGVQLSWYPDGGRESMESFVSGYRQGYSFRWHPDGSPESVEHYADGVRVGQAKYWDVRGALVACIDESGRDCAGGAGSREDGERSSPQLASRP
jgi:hypothetical protein